jgi:peptide subunit release factor 1 (eRF1)
MLAALPEHHALFRKVSHNPFLMDVAIGLDSGLISADHLRSEAWQAMEPKFQEKVAKLVDKFEEARSKHLGSADLTDIAQALIAGRVGILLVEADRQIPGKLDPASGRIELADLADPEIDDLLDDLAEIALKMGGEVVVIPAEHMPTTSGAAATYRF